MISLNIIYMILFLAIRKGIFKNKLLIYSVLSISLVFICIMSINNQIYSKLDAGYNIAKFLNKLDTKLLVVDYKIGYSSLEFHNDMQYTRVSNNSELQNLAKPYYLVINSKQLPEIQQLLPNILVLKKFMWIRQEKFIPTLFNDSKRVNDTENLLVIYVHGVNL